MQLIALTAELTQEEQEVVCDFLKDWRVIKAHGFGNILTTFNEGGQVESAITLRRKFKNIKK